MDYRTRQLRLLAAMRKVRVDALLVTHLPDVRYLCGFTGSNAALAIVGAQHGAGARLFTDGRYTAQAKLEVDRAAVRIVKGSALARAVEFLAATRATRCGFDSAVTTVQSLTAMRAALTPKDGVRRPASFLKPLPPLVGGLREVKDDEEVGRLRRAAHLGCELYDGMLQWIEAGMREIDVAAELEHRARSAGAEGMSFETIVASGVRSSMPHARATTATLEPGTLLTLDFGIILEGYCSDMTRTLWIGGAGNKSRASDRAEQRHVFEAVLEAQQNAVAAVRPGTTTGEVDEAARSVLRKAGLGKYFSHSTGHGLGLEIHESPRVAAKQTQVLQVGNVITVEPGAYLPGRFGVRIEDTVAVTDSGCEVLTPTHRGWIEL